MPNVRLTKQAKCVFSIRCAVNSVEPSNESFAIPQHKANIHVARESDRIGRI
jgi:hypothetical protein